MHSLKHTRVIETISPFLILAYCEALTSCLIFPRHFITCEQVATVDFAKYCIISATFYVLLKVEIQSLKMSIALTVCCLSLLHIMFR